MLTVSMAVVSVEAEGRRGVFSPYCTGPAMIFVNRPLRRASVIGKLFGYHGENMDDGPVVCARRNDHGKNNSDTPGRQVGARPKNIVPGDHTHE